MSYFLAFFIPVPSFLTMFSSYLARTTKGRVSSGPAGVPSASLSVSGSRGSVNGKQCERGRVSSLTSKVSGNARPSTAGLSVGSKWRCPSDSDDELQPVSAGLSQPRNGDSSSSVIRSTTFASRPKSMTLQPLCVQQLKRIARKMAEDSGIPLEKLNQFIEVHFITLHVNHYNYLSRSLVTCF